MGLEACTPFTVMFRGRKQLLVGLVSQHDLSLCLSICLSACLCHDETTHSFDIFLFFSQGSLAQTKKEKGGGGRSALHFTFAFFLHILERGWGGGGRQVCIAFHKGNGWMGGSEGCDKRMMIYIHNRLVERTIPVW